MNYLEIAGPGFTAGGDAVSTAARRHKPCDLAGEADRTVPIRDTGCRMRADISDDSPSDDLPAGCGRSLVPLGAPRTDDPGADDLMMDARRRWRPSAAFLAQLVATAQGAPQTRARRRAAQEQASALYTATTRVAQPNVIKIST